MAQIFHPSTNTIAKATIFGALFIVAAIGWSIAQVQRSSYITNEGIAREQPIPFSHEHHVSGLGIDCRYCHTSVTESSFAGLPSTKVCMTCHSQIWTNSKLLEPLRASWREGVPVTWTRVHDLPDFAHFNHSAHVNKGVACVTCHGQVDEMPLMWQNASLHMEWCLSCHRDPAPNLRDRKDVFNMKFTPPGDRRAAGEALIEKYKVATNQLMNCSVCHY